MKAFSESKSNGADNYYSTIKELKETFNIKVVTANYTTFCENISGLGKNDIAYVHVRFELFENPRTLNVVDYDSENEPHTDPKDVYFPYIFVQSCVKLIVDRIQITEYAKMLDFLDKADKIIIVGYRLNSDDNHINSIIRSAVISKNEVIYLVYDNNNASDRRKNEKNG